MGLNGGGDSLLVLLCKRDKGVVEGSESAVEGSEDGELRLCVVQSGSDIRQVGGKDTTQDGGASSLVQGLGDGARNLKDGTNGLDEKVLVRDLIQDLAIGDLDGGSTILGAAMMVSFLSENEVCRQATYTKKEMGVPSRVGTITWVPFVGRDSS